MTAKRRNALARHLCAAALAAAVCYFAADALDEMLREPIYRAIGAVAPSMGRHYISVDDKGVARYHYPPPIGVQRNPVYVCHKAFEYWEDYMADPFYKEAYDGDSRTFFLNSADWLLEHAAKTEHGLVWQYGFDFEPYDMQAPWISAMAQGHAIQVLVRAHGLTRDARYLDAARQALGVFSVDVADGGVRIIDEPDPEAWWYCEYPAAQNAPRVLNGMVFALFGIHELYLATGDETARRLWENGLRAVRLSLGRYDAGAWSRYNARGRLASKHYHRVHVNQMHRLYDMTGDETYRQYAQRWGQAPAPRAAALPWRLFARGSFPRMDLLMIAIAFAVPLALVEGLMLLRRRPGRPPAAQSA